MTRREKDYPVIGELARLVTEPGDQLLLSRSASDLIALCRQHRDLANQLATSRPLLRQAMAPDPDPDQVWAELDAERRSLIRADATRMARYERSSSAWRVAWPHVHDRIAGLPLREAHAIVVREAEKCLPTEPAP
jgi:hypothetical protein